MYRFIVWLCVRGSYPFPLMSKVGEKVVGRGALIAGGVLMFPSMPKGEIVDQWLSMMSTQVAPKVTTILHGNFDLTTPSIFTEGSPIWILCIEMFPLIYGISCSSSRFEIYSCLMLVSLVSGLKSHRVVACHSSLVVVIE